MAPTQPSEVQHLGNYNCPLTIYFKRTFKKKISSMEMQWSSAVDIVSRPIRPSILKVLRWKLIKKVNKIYGRITFIIKQHHV